MNKRWRGPAGALHVGLAGVLLAVFSAVTPALAAEGLDGRSLGPGWALPFLGLLLCIATGPLLFHRTWEHHYGKIAAGWALLALVPLAVTRGGFVTLELLLHATLVEYLPFFILLFTLYTVAGGILITGNLRGTPLVNTGLLALGTVFASIVGTTGASMILIRPLIRANDERRHQVHVVIFFIFLVSNIGGSLTPLGDPPLFVGFLRGVDFFWTTKHLFLPTLFLSGVLLAGFFALDTWLRRSDALLPALPDKTPERGLKLYGGFNFALLAAVIAVILISSAWNPGISFSLPGAKLPLQSILRDLALLAICALSWKLTPKQVRAGNDFNWHPIAEVGKLFAAIFICVAPVILMLDAGLQGAFAPLVSFVTSASGAPIPQAYYWLTGILSAFLDNAPTYLVFFELAGGDAKQLMGPLANILQSISLGAVFMGALSYIGNAPNLMVCAIAKDMKVPMPGFIGYMGWSFGILLPLLALVGWLFVG